LIEATRSLRIGPADEAGTYVGPVIDDDAKERISAMIEQGKSDARLAYSADIGELAKDGCYVPPTIFAEVLSTSRIAQEEIFGPVLAVMRAADLTEALAI